MSAERALLRNSIIAVVIKDIVDNNGVIVTGGYSGVSSAHNNPALPIIKGCIVGDNCITSRMPFMNAPARSSIDYVI